jgi:hypothetical protein
LKRRDGSVPIVKFKVDGCCNCGEGVIEVYVLFLKVRSYLFVFLRGILKGDLT